MTQFQVGIALIDENAHPCVYAGMGYVEPEAAIVLGATMIGAGHQAARMGGRKISAWRLWREVFKHYARGVGLFPLRQPECEWKERQG